MAKSKARSIVRENGMSGLFCVVNFTYIFDLYFSVLTLPCNFPGIGEKVFQKGDCYAKENVVRMHVGTVCSHTAFAGMEHAASIGIGKRGKHGKGRGYRGRRGGAWSGGHGYLC